MESLVDVMLQSWRVKRLSPVFSMSSHSEITTWFKLWGTTWDRDDQ